MENMSNQNKPVSSQKSQDSISIDRDAFSSRVAKVFRSWPEDCDGIVVFSGRQSDDAIETKTLAVQQWLFGYEFTDTLVLLTREKTVRFLASAKKISILKQLEGISSVKTEFFVKGDDSDVFKHVSAGITSLSSIKKETHDGAFADEWTKYETSNFPQSGNASPAISTWLTSKDDKELAFMRKSSQLSVTLMKSVLIKEVEDVVENETKRSHKKIADKVDAALSDQSLLKKWKSKMDLEPDFCDLVYAVVQSGNDFKLRPDAAPDTSNLDPGCVVLGVGGKYHEYASNVARTLFVDPTKSQKDAYSAASSLLDLLIESVRPGISCQAVYEKALSYLDANHPELKQYLIKDVGSCIGLEFRDANNMLNTKSTRLVESSSTYNVCVGFQDLKNEKGKTFSIWLGDTVYVSDASTTNLTSGVSRSKDDVFYFFEESASEAEEAPKKAPAVIEPRTRNRRNAQDDEEERKKMMEKQQELRNKLSDEIKGRYLEVDQDGDAADVLRSTSVEQKRHDHYIAYKDKSELPRDIKSMKTVHLDTKRDVLLVPIGGKLVPFHVRLIKTVTKPEDNPRLSQLRVTFFTPGQASFGQSLDLFPKIDGNAIYLKELNIQCEDGRNLSAVFRGIKEMQKRMKMKDAEEELARDMKEQPQLKLIKDRPRPVLRDLNVKPQTGPQGRSKAVGTLEAHENGFRFTTSKAEHIDIIYRNIQHAIFQPCENDQVVLLHFNLKDPIMVGKKKTSDIQFYTETRSAADDLGMRKRAGYDPDELMEEQREREMISKLNKLFKDFVKKCEDEVLNKYNIEFDMPYRELSFTGTPGKSNVDIFPCRDCLVAVSEWPPFIFTLKDIEMVYFERVSFGLRNFDIVFVHKDFSKVPMRISAIPTQSLDQIKAWLCELDIVFYEGPTNMNWGNILKEVNKDKKGFAEAGGWEAWFGESSGSEDEEEDDEDSEFDEEDDDSDEEFEESDDSDDESLVTEDSDDESEASLDSEESEGLDWDELEEKAAKADKEKVRKRSKESDDESDRKKKRRK